MATINEIVANDFRMKMRLERIFTPEVKSIFNLTANRFRASVAATGSPQTIRRGVWQFVLEKQYTRTQKAFRGEVIDQQKALKSGWFIRKAIESKQAELSPSELALLQLALLTWSEESSETSAELISDTTERNMDQSIRQARGIIIDEQLPTDNLTLAAVAFPILRRKFAGRVTGITSSETQASAEATKLMEAETLSGVTPFVLLPEGVSEITDSTKRWVTVGDNKVRTSPFNHRAANGQMRPLEQAFDVSGERLRSPGDASLGSSIGNRINCRCSGVFRVA